MQLVPHLHFDESKHVWFPWQIQMMLWTKRFAESDHNTPSDQSLVSEWRGKTLTSIMSFVPSREKAWLYPTCSQHRGHQVGRTSGHFILDAILDCEFQLTSDPNLPGLPVTQGTLLVWRLIQSQFTRWGHWEMSNGWDWWSFQPVDGSKEMEWRL